VTALWRLTRRIHAAKQALHLGAQSSGGRWNPRGLAVVYSGTSISLVALEYFVHLSGDEPADLVLVEIRVPDGASTGSIAPADLPADWQEELALTQSKGRQWIESRRSLALRVPSAIVPEESNVLLNPSHPAWERVAVRVRRPFRYDLRMYKS